MPPLGYFDLDHIWTKRMPKYSGVDEKFTKHLSKQQQQCRNDHFNNYPEKQTLGYSFHHLEKNTSFIYIFFYQMTTHIKIGLRIIRIRAFKKKFLW